MYVNLAANEMFEEKGLVKNCGSRFGRHKKLSNQVRHLVIVTNEIFEAASYEGRYHPLSGISGDNQSKTLEKMADEIG